MELINSLKKEVIDRLVNQIALTCYELKLIDWSTGQIADALGLSERKVKALIRSHAAQTKSHNPLMRYQALNIVDISHLVSKDSPLLEKSRPDLASPTRTQL